MKSKKVTVEWIKDNKSRNEHNIVSSMSNPIKNNYSNKSTLVKMISDILDKELPMLKNNSLMHDLVLYTLTEKMYTVQTVENVLSYIKRNHGKQVQDVCFRNGEVHIKCSI